MASLPQSLPHIDECRYLILKIIEQAVRDYLSLQQSNAPIERHYYETACQFLFDDDYRIDYGEEEKSLNDLLDIIGIESEWLREKVVQLKDKRIRQFRFRSGHEKSNRQSENISRRTNGVHKR